MSVLCPVFSLIFVRKKMIEVRTIPFIFILLMVVVTPCAYADELTDAKTELENTTMEVTELVQAVETAQDEINEKLDVVVELQSSISSIAVAQDEIEKIMYKNNETENFLQVLLNSRDLRELLVGLEYTNKIYSHYVDLKTDKQEKVVLLQQEIETISAVKDSQENQLVELKNKKEELSDKVSKLKTEASLSAEVAAAVVAGSAATFATGDTDGWKTGTASAYGGYSDAQIGSNAHTATGAAVTESSMGVAIPLAWGNVRSYYGRQVEISYNGQSVIATVNDCGGMGGGSRVLDLQPGVFHAFGASSCNDWGLRTVKYRFL